MDIFKKDSKNNVIQDKREKEQMMEWNKINLSPVIFKNPLFQSFLKLDPKILKTMAFEFLDKKDDNQSYSGVVAVKTQQNAETHTNKEQTLYSFVCYNIASSGLVKPQKITFKQNSVYTTEEKKNLKFFDFLASNQNRKIQSVSFLAYIDESSPTNWHVKCEIAHERTSDYEKGMKEVFYYSQDGKLSAKDYIVQQDGNFYHSFIARDFVEDNMILIGKFDTNEENVSLLEVRMKKGVEIIAFNTKSNSETLMNSMGYEEVIDLIESDSNRKKELQKTTGQRDKTNQDGKEIGL